MNKIAVKLSIVIVYFGGYKQLKGLLESIKEDKTKDLFEIIIVNNKPREDIEAEIKKIFRKIIYIKSPANIGYARGNNLGVRSASGKYIFIINPDTSLKSGTLEALIRLLDKNKKAALAGPNFTYPDSKAIEYRGTRILTPFYAVFAMSFVNKLWPNNPVSKKYFLKDTPINKIKEVDVVSGTAFIIRKTVFEEVGGFDENFFLFFEENDLCKRVRESGWKIYINPAAVVAHDWKPGEGGKLLNRYFNKSRFYYFRKHYGILSAIIVDIVVRTSKQLLFMIFILVVSLVIMLYKFT